MSEQSVEQAKSSYELDSEAKACLTQYWQDIGAFTVLDQLSIHDKRVMQEAPLLLSLEPVKPVANPDSHGGQKDKNIFLNKPRRWLPKTRQETKWADELVFSKSLRRAAKNKRPRRSLQRRYSAVRSIYNDAADDYRAYNQVLVIARDGNRPDIDRLRSALPVQFAMGDRLFARECLEKGSWPTKADFIAHRRHWRGFMVAASQYASDSVLAEAYEHFREEAADRLDFWRARYSSLSGLLGQVAITDARPDPTAATAKPAAETTSDAPAKGADIPDLWLRKTAERARSLEDKAARIETLVNQGTPRHLADLRVLGAPGIYYEGRLVGIGEKDKQPSATALVAAAQPRKNTAPQKPGIRRQPGYDHERDPSNPRLF